MSVFIGIVNMLDDCIYRHSNILGEYICRLVNMLDECICRHSNILGECVVGIV